jgi:hypothetical protein
MVLISSFLTRVRLNKIELWNGKTTEKPSGKLLGLIVMSH